MSDIPLAELSECGAMAVHRFAEWAGIGRTLAWEQIRTGELQAIKVSRRTLITGAAAKRWLSSRPSLQSKPVTNHAP